MPAHSVQNPWPLLAPLPPRRASRAGSREQQALTGWPARPAAAPPSRPSPKSSPSHPQVTPKSSPPTPAPISPPSPAARSLARPAPGTQCSCPLHLRPTPREPAPPPGGPVPTAPRRAHVPFKYNPQPAATTTTTTYPPPARRRHSPPLSLPPAASLPFLVSTSYSTLPHPPFSLLHPPPFCCISACLPPALPETRLAAPSPVSHERLTCTQPKRGAAPPTRLLQTLFRPCPPAFSIHRPASWDRGAPWRRHGLTTKVPCPRPPSPRHGFVN